MTLHRLSQSHLKVLSECPRKFEHTYLDLLAAHVAPEQRERMEWGSQFHRLMQQRELGLPLTPILAAEPDLERAMTGLFQVAPQLFAIDPQVTRDSEQIRTLLIQDYLFTAIYDLVLLGTTAQIIDWKTYGKPLHPARLAQEWQTRLYFYIMAETSNYPPAAISFTYWFVLSQPEPQSVELFYSDLLHQQTQQDLEQILVRLDHWLAARRQGQAFPQVSVGSPLCLACSFASRCNRLSTSTPAISQVMLNLSDIAEIVI